MVWGSVQARGCPPQPGAVRGAPPSPGERCPARGSCKYPASGRAWEQFGVRCPPATSHRPGCRRGRSGCGLAPAAGMGGSWQRARKPPCRAPSLIQRVFNFWSCPKCRGGDGENSHPEQSFRSVFKALSCKTITKPGVLLVTFYSNSAADKLQKCQPVTPHLAYADLFPDILLAVVCLSAFSLEAQGVSYQRSESGFICGLLYSCSRSHFAASFDIP